MFVLFGALIDVLLTLFFLRRRYSREERRASTSRESKDYNNSKARYYKVDRKQHRKEKDKKDDKDKRDDACKYEEGRDKKDDEKEKKDNEKDKWEDMREKKASKEKKESSREKRSDSREKSSEVKERREREREKDEGKERDIMSSSSWLELKSCGITMGDIIEIRKHDYSERSTKNRFVHDLCIAFLLR